jgi:hypothetical protein
MSTMADCVDRVKRLFAAMTDALDAHPERGDERIVMLFTLPREGGRPISGLLSHGYVEPTREIPMMDTKQMADLLTHLTATLRAQGVALMLFPVNRDE